MLGKEITTRRCNVMIKQILLVFSLVLTYKPAKCQVSVIWGDLKKGKHEVGFKTLFEFDQTRTFHQPHPVTGEVFTKETARPIRISVWYPAIAGSGNKMNYSDYIFIKPPDKRFSEYNTAISDYDYWATLHWTNGLDTSAKKILNIPVLAKRNAIAKKGKFPLIIHFLGLNDRRNENIPLWEYLASNGYVVVTIPQISGFSDVSLELWGFSVSGKETQVRDMEFAVSKLKTWTNIDFRNIGCIGYSYGSIFAMRMAMMNANIKAIATYDGTINNKDEQNITQSFFNPTVKASWLNIYRSKNEGVDLKLFNELKYCNRYKVSYTNASHGDFEDFAIASSLLPFQAPEYALKERDIATGKTNYETTCKLTLNFFNSQLKKIADAETKFNDLILTGKNSGIIKEFGFIKGNKMFDDEQLTHIIIYYGIAEAEKKFNTIRQDNEYECLVTKDGLLNYAKALKMGGRRVEKSNDVLLFIERNFAVDNKVYLEFAGNMIELKKYPEAKKYLDNVIKTEPGNEEALKLLELIKDISAGNTKNLTWK